MPTEDGRQPRPVDRTQQLHYAEQVNLPHFEQSWLHTTALCRQRSRSPTRLHSTFCRCHSQSRRWGRSNTLGGAPERSVPISSFPVSVSDHSCYLHISRTRCRDQPADGTEVSVTSESGPEVHLANCHRRLGRTQ